MNKKCVCLRSISGMQGIRLRTFGRTSLKNERDFTHRAGHVGVCVCLAGWAHISGPGLEGDSNGKDRQLLERLGSAEARYRRPLRQLDDSSRGTATSEKVPVDSEMRGMWGLRPLATVERGNECLDNLVKILESRGVIVDRPTPLQWNQAIGTPDFRNDSMMT